MAEPVTARFVVVALPVTDRVAKKSPVVVALVVVERVALRPVIVAFVAVRLAMVPREVKEELSTFAANVVPVRVPAGAITAFVPAAVIKPLAFTVKFGIAVDEPHEPVFEFTVARVVVIPVVPEPVISPDRVIV